MSRRLLPLALLTLLLTTACREVVLTGRPEQEANAALAALVAAGLDAAKRPAGRDGFDVVVPGRDVAAAVSTLAAAGLPRKEEPGLQELFGEPGLVPSALEEQARYHRALAGEVAQSLRRLPGVADARVHLALPLGGRRTVGAPPPAPVKASVLVTAVPGGREALVRSAGDIAGLVAGAVAGLGPDAVTVMVGATAPPMPISTGAATGTSAGATAGPALSQAAPAGAARAALAGAGLTTALAGLGLAGFVVVRPRLRRRQGDAA